MAPTNLTGHTRMTTGTVRGANPSGPNASADAAAAVMRSSVRQISAGDATDEGNH